MHAASVLGACAKCNYIALRHYKGHMEAYNCRYAFSIFSRLQVDANAPTKWISYRPISFHEYISLKVPFLKSSSLWKINPVNRL